MHISTLLNRNQQRLNSSLNRMVKTVYKRFGRSIRFGLGLSFRNRFEPYRFGPNRLPSWLSLNRFGLDQDKPVKPKPNHCRREWALDHGGTTHMSARPYNGRPFACLLRLLLSNRKHRQQWRSRHAAFLPVCLSVFFVCLLASFLPQEHSTMAEQTWQLREERKKLPSIILHGRLLPSKKRSNLSTNRARVSILSLSICLSLFLSLLVFLYRFTLKP